VSRPPRLRLTFRLRTGLPASTAVTVGLAILVVAIALSVLQPLLGLPSPYAQDYSSLLRSPGWAHLFGTDALGRDVFARTIAATRLDLLVAAVVTVASAVGGVLAGATAGFVGGKVDAIIMRLADVALSVPLLVLVLAIIAIVGPGLEGFYVAVPAVGWAPYARITRAEMLVVREKEFVSAARTLGFSPLRTLLRHAIPNTWRSSAVFSMSDIVGNIMLLAALSYLGLGAQPPRPEWGAIIADGQASLTTAWWISTLPGFFVVIVGVGFSMIGDGLSETIGSGT
jgi:peptide/nickel transport system permease protein